MFAEQNLAERRAFPRMSIERPIAFRVLSDGSNQVGELRSLSGNGLLFVANSSVPVGESLRIRVNPPLTLTPPLHAEVEVVRCLQANGNGFAVAAKMTRLL